jgi:hypothetical protein
LGNHPAVSFQSSLAKNRPSFPALKNFPQKIFLELFLNTLQVPSPFQEIHFRLAAVLESDISFLISTQLPGLDDHHVSFPYPKFPPQPAGNAADAFFSIQAQDAHPASSQALLDDA